MKYPNCGTEMIVGYLNRNDSSKKIAQSESFKWQKKEKEYNAAFCPRCSNIIFIGKNEK